MPFCPFLLCLLFLCWPVVGWAQKEIAIGSRYEIYSDQLQEQRTFWVSLPSGYDPASNRSYPVVYLLDGESLFHVLVGMYHTLETVKGEPVPPTILVGIVSGDRTLDFTPTASAAGRDGQIPSGAEPQGGGSESFYRFLTDELRARIDSMYPTNGPTMLIGHSYGGLFVLNTFLHHTDAFDNYLAVDPSLWWDQGRIVREASDLMPGKDYTGKQLYVAVATKKRTDRVDIHPDLAQQLATDILPKAQYLHFFYQSFPEENHGTVSIPGIFDGLKKLYGK